MHLQSFQNLEVGSARLRIYVVACCAYIKSACLRQNIEMGGIGLKIQIEVSLSRKNTEVYCMHECYRGVAE